MAEYVIPALALVAFWGGVGFFVWKGHQRAATFRAAVEGAAAAHGLAVNMPKPGRGVADFELAGHGLDVTITRPRKRGQYRTRGLTQLRKTLPGGPRELILFPDPDRAIEIGRSFAALNEAGMKGQMARGAVAAALGRELVPYLARLKALETPAGLAFSTAPTLPEGFDTDPIAAFQSAPWPKARPSVMFLDGDIYLRLQDDPAQGGLVGLFLAQGIALLSALSRRAE